MREARDTATMGLARVLDMAEQRFYEAAYDGDDSDDIVPALPRVRLAGDSVRWRASRTRTSSTVSKLSSAAAPPVCAIAATSGHPSTTLLRPLANCHAATPASASAQRRCAESPSDSRHTSNTIALNSSSAPTR